MEFDVQFRTPNYEFRAPRSLEADMLYAMLNGRRFGWVGLVLVLAAGCTSKAGPAIQDDGSPTADSGYILQGTTGGDAANTFNIRNHVGGEQPAILMTPPDEGTAPQPAGASSSTPAAAAPSSQQVVPKHLPGAGKPAARAAKPVPATSTATSTKPSKPAPRAGAKPPVKPGGTKV